MKRSSVEMSVGVFVLIGILAVGYMTVKLGKMELLSDNYWPVKAIFQSVAGLKTGARVEISGVDVGRVKTIALDLKTYSAMVTMDVRNDIVLSTDTIASVRTSGLIGDKYIKLSPGGMPDNLKPNEVITDTESAIDIEELIGKYVFGSAEGSGDSKDAGAGQSPAAGPAQKQSN